MFTRTDLEQHPLWQVLAKVEAVLSDHSGQLRLQDPGFLNALTQLVNGIHRINKVDPWRFSKPSARLDKLSAVLTELEGALAAFEAEPEAAKFADVELRAEELRLAFNQCPHPIVTTGRMTNVTAAVELVESSSRAAIDRLREASDSEISALTSRLQELDDMVSQVNTALDETRRELALVTKQSKDIETSVTETHATQSTAFAKLVTEQQAALAEELESHRTKLESQLADSRKAAVSRVEAIRALEDQGKTLLGKISERTISHDYAAYARRQGLAAGFWTVAAAAVTIASLYLVWQKTVGHDLEPSGWEVLGLRTLLTAMIVAVAGYLSVVAGHHRDNARRAKQAQLDLNALEPYLAHLQPAEATAVRNEFARHHFLRGPGETRRGPLIVLRDHSRSDETRVPSGR